MFRARVRSMSRLISGQTHPRCGAPVWGSSGEVELALPDLIGLRHLSRLLERPGRDVTAVEVVGAGSEQTAQEVLDDTAIHAYRQRVRELVAAVDEAETDADLARAERLRLEREEVAAELSRSLGLGGRARGSRRGPSGPARACAQR